MVIEYLQKEFPYSVALAVVHQNTNNTHVHVHLQARDIEGKQWHISPSGYRNLDVGWGQIIAREFGVEILERHLSKKEQTRQYKKEMAQGNSSVIIEKPQRTIYRAKDFQRIRERKKVS